MQDITRYGGMQPEPAPKVQHNGAELASHFGADILDELEQRWQAALERRCHEREEQQKEAPMNTPVYTAEELIARFRLEPHVEGGAFRELYKEGYVPDGTRPAHGVIYYLLGENETSDFHVLDADEYWLWHAGPDIELWSYPEGNPAALKVERMGMGENAQPCVLMKAGTIFGARPVKGAKGAMLCSCVCVPEFMYEHYRILTKDEVLAECPASAAFFE